MRNKIAKQLRKDAKMLAVASPWEAYTKLNEHHKYVFNTKSMVFEPCLVYTQMLDACQKAQYKHIKQLYKTGKLTRKSS